VLYVNGVSEASDTSGTALNMGASFENKLALWGNPGATFKRVATWDSVIPVEDLTPVTLEADAIGYIAGLGPAVFEVEADDVILAVMAQAKASSASTVPPTATPSGGAAIDAFTTIGSTYNWDTAGVSRGAMGVYAARVTAAGTVSVNTGGTLSGMIVKISGADLTSGVASAIGTITQATPALTDNISITPGASTGNGWRQLFFPIKHTGTAQVYASAGGLDELTDAQVSGENMNGYVCYQGVFVRTGYSTSTETFNGGSSTANASGCLSIELNSA
jgi:hypothetical protein